MRLKSHLSAVETASGVAAVVVAAAGAVVAGAAVAVAAAEIVAIAGKSILRRVCSMPIWAHSGVGGLFAETKGQRRACGMRRRATPTHEVVDEQSEHPEASKGTRPPRESTREGRKAQAAARRPAGA